ncbi:hypothetical protein J1N35_026438 [Gossypium stocksii]|uniref:GDSL esterase/lipase 6 n=1 Tax=Gossypium stocksii TaxID=47602 RepID=A0A9D3V8S6_9ROSI|nr:hypothetical protein J1N35_026438 [Gossypium stocksii]
MEKKNLYTHLLILLVLINLSSSLNVPAIFIFGDSVFDAGNNHFIKNCSVQADFPPYGSTFFHRPTGRFTDGRTVADFISQFIGIGLQQPYLEAQIAVMNGSRKEYPSKGLNFASAGSGVLQGTNKGWGVLPIQEQLRQFKTLIEQKAINRSVVERSLFFLESGSNDIFNYFLPLDTPKLDPDAYVEAMIKEVTNLTDQIYKVGARRLVVFSLGPVGCVPARALLPAAPINRCYGKMNAMVKKYNKGLESLVNDIPTRHPGAIGVYGAVYDTVQHIRAAPTRYGMIFMEAYGFINAMYNNTFDRAGFSNVSSACCGDGPLGGQVQCGKEGYKICQNPQGFLFWDYFHPTQHTYELISKALWEGKKSRIRPINLKTLTNLTLALV